jgi:hypothetical protein
MKRAAQIRSTADLTAGPHTLTVAIEHIDPMTAELYLGTNERNRILRDTHARRLADAITRGEWSLNGNTIVFDSEGQLADGQHRLQAIVLSGIPAVTLVVRGVLPVVAQDTMDIGARRSLGGQLAVHGEENASCLGAAIAVVYKVEPRGEWVAEAPTTSQGLKILADHPGLRDAAAFGCKMKRSALKYPEGMAAGLLYLFSGADPDNADVFWQQLHDGLGFDKTSPIYLLRKRLLSDASIGRGGVRMSARQRAGITIKAWNYWRAGAKMKQLRYNPGGVQREDFPRYDADPSTIG